MTALTWVFVLVVVLIASALSIVGCGETPRDKRIERETKNLEVTGHEDLEIVEVTHNGKTFTVLLWHKGYGSDMEVLEVRDAEVHSDTHP